MAEPLSLLIMVVTACSRRLPSQLQRTGKTLQRKVRDHFNAADWNKKRLNFKKAYDHSRNKPDIIDWRTARYLIDLDRDIGSRDNFASRVEIKKDYKNIWTFDKSEEKE